MPDLETRQNELGAGYWELTLIDIQITRKALFFKTVRQQKHGPALPRGPSQIDSARGSGDAKAKALSFYIPRVAAIRSARFALASSADLSGRACFLSIPITLSFSEQRLVSRALPDKGTRNLDLILFIFCSSHIQQVVP